MDLQAEVDALKKRWHEFAETVGRPDGCPICNARVWWDGTRTRTASVRLSGKTVHIGGICCRRARCADDGCSHRWCLFPPGLGPRRHFQACVVSEAVQEYLFAPDASQESTAERYECSRRTLGRWVGWLAGLAEPAVIQERILVAQDEPVLAPLRAVTSLFRKTCSEVARKLLETAALVLAHLEALAMARGLEPPGLRSVLETVAPVGARRTTQSRPLLPEFARRRPRVHRRPCPCDRGDPIRGD